MLVEKQISQAYSRISECKNELAQAKRIRKNRQGNKVLHFSRVPTQTGKPGKPGKMGRHFPVREKSGNFEQTGKVRENHTKYWKTEIN